MDETMMGDLASLKRPALQKLCKRFGIKANGKNVDMIRALEELRESASLVVQNIENMPDSQLSQPEASVALPSKPSPSVDEVNPSTRKSKKRRKGGRKKKDVKRKELSPSPIESAGDTPLSLSGVSNKPCAWLTAGTDSFNLSDSQLSCHQSIQNSPPRGRKRRHSGSVDTSPKLPAPVAKHARYELPHQALDNDSISTEQPCESTVQVSTSPFQAPADPISSPQAPISPPQASNSPQTPISPQAPVSPTQAPTSPSQGPTSPPQAPISPPQPLISPQESFSPPPAPTSPEAPFSPPLANEDFQSNCKRKRKSTYTLDGGVCDEPCAVREEEEREGEEPPSKRVRRATFSVSPKITNKKESEINGTVDENISAKVAAHGAEALNGIMDVHSEIMDLLDKRVEKIQADPNYKPVFSADESSSKSPLKTGMPIAKKFDSAHKKQFSRMQSIVSYQSEKERRCAAVRKGSTPYTGNIPRPMDKRKSKIPKAPIAASRPKSTASFKPTALSVKQASFNFAANGAKVVDKKAPKLSKEAKPAVASVKEPCENKMRKSVVASKTPGKKGGPGIVAKTPSSVVKFSATASCASTKKPKPQFDVTKSLKNKPTYKPHSGKLPDFNIYRY